MNDKVFSMHRLGLLWRFYTPAIRLQLAISGITLLMSYFICLAGAAGALTAKITENGGWVALYSFGAMIASYVFLSGPLVFAYCGQRRVATTLPASWQEKAVFMLGYVFMLVPLFLAAIWYGSMGVMSFFTPAADVNATISHILLSETHGLSFDSIMSGSKFGSTVAETATAAFSCFVIVAARRNRLALGIVAVFGARLLNWLAGVIVGIYAVLSSGIVSRVAKGDTDIAPQDLIGFIADAMPYYTALSALLTLVFAALAVSKIKNRRN